MGIKRIKAGKTGLFLAALNLVPALAVAGETLVQGLEGHILPGEMYTVQHEVGFDAIAFVRLKGDEKSDLDMTVRFFGGLELPSTYLAAEEYVDWFAEGQKFVIIVENIGQSPSGFDLEIGYKDLPDSNLVLSSEQDA